MGFSCGFYNSEQGDREYFNEDLSNFLEGLITDGIYEFLGDDKMMVKAAATPNMTVNIGTGRAWFNARWAKIDALYPVELDPADSVQNRIDAICLTINNTRAVRDSYIEVIKGEGSVGTATKPEVSDETNIFRHVLAYVTVNAGTTAITQAQIENRVGMGTAPYSKPKWEEIPSETVEQMTAQWQSEFAQFMDHIHETFDYDAAGNLQVGVENLAPDINDITSDDLYALDHNVLKKKNNDNWTPTKVSSEIMDMKSTFQDGVDAVYNAVVAEGVTPASSTPEAIAAAIATIRNGGNAAASEILKTKTAYSGKTLRTGTMENRNAWSSTGTPSGKNQVDVVIPAGYHNGSGKVTCKGQTAFEAGFNYARNYWEHRYSSGSANYYGGTSNAILYAAKGYHIVAVSSVDAGVTATATGNLSIIRSNTYSVGNNQRVTIFLCYKAATDPTGQSIGHLVLSSTSPYSWVWVELMPRDTSQA